jgi:hypothetical protein
MFRKKDLEKIKTHFTFNNIYFFENLAIYEIMWGEKRRGRPAKDDNMALAQCMLDT